LLEPSADLIKAGETLNPKDIWEEKKMLYLNGTPLPTTRFPDNTSQVWKIPQDQLEMASPALVAWEYTHEAEFIEIAQLKDLLDKQGIPAILKIKYLPYGRQDKEISNDATFGLRSFAKLLNVLNFEGVLITDPHSLLALDLINNSYAIYPHRQIEYLIFNGYCSLVCYPDKGARTKYEEVYKKEIGKAFIYGEKVRDQLTGNITKYDLIDEIGGRVKGQKVLIIDDICDGGMTFKILAKDLLEAGATEVNLFVTHGIFSKGVRTLRDAGITHIFTQDGEAFHLKDSFKGCRIKSFKEQE
jgi:ribose-phosphate pyrophosphokinase